MSIRGVAQLRALRLVYCDVTGTSRGIKEFVLSGGWDEFKARALVHGDSTEALQLERLVLMKSFSLGCGLQCLILEQITTDVESNLRFREFSDTFLCSGYHRDL